MAFRLALRETQIDSSTPSSGVVPTSRGRARSAKRWLATALAASALLPNTGCSILTNAQKNLSRHDAMDDFLVNYRNAAWSKRAWLCNHQAYHNHPYRADLEAGFRQGYEDVAAGGNGCTPAVCPRSYWGWQYQSPDGQKRMNAWFEGYPLGVRAAEQDGIGHWGNVVTSFPPPAAGPQGAGAWPAGHPAGTPPLGGAPTPDPTVDVSPEMIPAPVDPERVKPPAIRLQLVN